MNETLKKIGISLFKLGITVAISQVLNQSVRDLGNSTISEITKGIRSVRNTYEQHKAARAA